ncbi:hypothetical protein GAYE_SCF16G3617 [Galdieria yellowstonensis]|uniref:Condensin complex subunit 2 n=1 Tax=Galdieria yellowstonensis TaxID=3028027 RepID=A0AAV9IEB4_9RHOD|nr:hypothetical protein GAYE_SCF16G3617 [Galdieria yellowstonensis]
MEQTLLQETSSWTTPKNDTKTRRRLSSFFKNSPSLSAPSKTPEHAQASVATVTTTSMNTPLRFNDDEAEKQAARKAKRNQLLFSSSKELATNHNDNWEEKLDPRQLAQLYSTTIKLCRDNKINAKNSWSLALIDHLRSLVVSGEIRAEDVPSEETEEPSEANFQLAGVTLDASTKIYSYRVDSVHTSAYSVLGDLTRTGRTPQDNESIEDEDSEEPTNEMSTAKRKQTKSRTQGECTLEKNVDNISVKSYDVEHMLDPLFQVISRAIHNGETSHSLLHVLKLSHEPCKDGACHLVFDSQRPFFASSQNGSVGMHPPKKYRESCHFIKKSLQSHPDWLSMEVDDWDCICPEMKQCFRNVFQRAVDQENQRPKNKSAENPEMLRNETPEWTPIDYSSVHLDSHDGLESWNEEWALLEARWTNPHGELFPLEETSGMEEEERKQWIADMFAHGADMFQVEEMLHGEANTQWNDNKLQSLLSLSWAGPTHWKFFSNGRNATATFSNEPQKGERKTEKRSRSKVDKLLEFSEPVEDVDFCTAFSQPKNPSSILLSNASWSKDEDSANLLPPDLHYQPSDLFRLFLKPTYLLKNTNGTSRNRLDWDTEDLDEGIRYGSIGNEQEEEMNSACVGMRSSFAGDSAVPTGNGEEEWEFVEQPYKVEKVDIPFATMAKNVDIRQLKQDMWRIISEHGFSSTDSSNTCKSFSLRQLVNILFEQYNEHDKKEITPPYLFICLLHLANEKGLFLRELEDMSDICMEPFS